MASLIRSFSMAGALALVAGGVGGCGGDDLECGAGTEEVDGACVATVECGPDTVASNGECVPVDSGPAPTIASIEPASDFVAGGSTFTITGTGFANIAAGDTTVRFGDTLVEFTIDGDTTITGRVPLAPALSTDVTIENRNGTASTSFEYIGLYAADGKGGQPGHLYVVDPRNGVTSRVGVVASGADARHGVTGMAFNADGVLFASESSRGGDRVESSGLLTIDPATGAATVIGALETADETAHYQMPDVTFRGAALVGWSENGDVPVSIDTTSGEVSVLVDSDVSSAGSGLVTLLDGRVLVAPDGVGGDLFEVAEDGTTTTTNVTLTNENIDGGEVSAMTVFQGTVYAVLGGQGASVLATIDTTTGAVTPLGFMPFGIDALASDDPGSSSLGRFVPPSPSPAVAAELARSVNGCGAGLAGTARLSNQGRFAAVVDAAALARSSHSVRLSFAKRDGVVGVPVTALLGDLTDAETVSVTTCGGSATALAAAELAADADRYVLTTNQRGQLKLVDRATGDRLRNVVDISAR